VCQQYYSSGFNIPAHYRGQKIPQTQAYKKARNERLNELDITLVEMQQAILPHVSTDIGKLSYLWEQLK
jgi:NADH dehydrogenase FAD-containing subunit